MVPSSKAIMTRAVISLNIPSPLLTMHCCHHHDTWLGWQSLKRAGGQPEPLLAQLLSHFGCSVGCERHAPDHHQDEDDDMRYILWGSCDHIALMECCSDRDLPIHLTRYSRDHHYHQHHRHHHVFSSWCRSPMYNCAGAIISSFVILVPLRLVCSWFYQKCKDAFLSDIILVVCGNFSIYSPNTMPNLPEGMRLGGENLLVFITNQPTPPPLFNMSANT